MLVTFCFFNDTATTEIYTLSLHDALPILVPLRGVGCGHDLLTRDHANELPALVHYGEVFLVAVDHRVQDLPEGVRRDRKSTRLNSSHANISYAVFCLKKKTKLLMYFTQSI